MNCSKNQKIEETQPSRRPWSSIRLVGLLELGCKTQSAPYMKVYTNWYDAQVVITSNLH